MRSLRSRAVAALLSALVPAGAARAADVEFSGFASIVGGKVPSGSRDAPFTEFECPCFVADYNHAGLYARGASLRPESRLGVQADARLFPELSATVQVVGRAVRNGGGAAVEWAYLNYDLDASWSLQAGRRRIPLFYYSDFQDVGFAYPWIRPPQDLYGWDATNYNGIGVVHRASVGGWSMRASAFYGGERVKDSPTDRIYYSPAVIDVNWRNIAGADLEMARGGLTLRGVFIESKVRTYDRSNDAVIFEGRQKIYGLAANADWGDWRVRSEVNVFDRLKFAYKAFSAMLAVGHRFGKLTPWLTWSRYSDWNLFDDPYQRDRTFSATLRYDVTATSAMKLQFDRFQDRSTQDFVGSSRLLSVSYDVVF